MEKGYIDRIKQNLERPEPTPEGFKHELERFEAELTPQFIEAAKGLADDGEAQIILAQGELSQRVNELAEGLSVEATEAQIGELMNYFGISQSVVKMTLENKDIGVNSIDKLRYRIVHSLDKIREVMVKDNLLSEYAQQKLSELDRTSADFSDVVIPDDSIGD